MIGFEEALALVATRTPVLPPTRLPWRETLGLVLAERCVGLVDCPSAPSARMDGFALRAREAGGPLRIGGSRFAGDLASGALPEGEALRVTTGARLPPEADAVVPVEGTREEEGLLHVLGPVEAGDHLATPGAELARGAVLAEPGERLTPGRLGLLVAGGHERLLVHPRPRVALLGFGDELVPAGQPLRPGQLHASNLASLEAWLEQRGFDCALVQLAPDEDRALGEALSRGLAAADAVITSGGLWNGERDRTVPALRRLGAEIVFHQVRMGPGKSTAFALLGGKPVFCLSGRPMANQVAFLTLALPGLRRLADHRHEPGLRLSAALSETIHGSPGWTDFSLVTLTQQDGRLLAHPCPRRQGLFSLARAQGLVKLPENVATLPAGSLVEVLSKGAFP